MIIQWAQQCAHYFWFPDNTISFNNTNYYTKRHVLIHVASFLFI